MDLSKKSKSKLITYCREHKIKGYSKKSKDEILSLIAASETKPPPLPLPSPSPQPQQTNLDLLNECLAKHQMKDVCEKLNLCVGTVRRWQELKDVPPQYAFDLLTILGREIKYENYTSSQKDQFFTHADVAQNCWNSFRKMLPLDLSPYTFIEPSAGDGSFLKVLPQGSIGLDIEPRAPGIAKTDYLSWMPTDRSKKYIVFGNPPFGLRGHLALKFINHSHSFADYVCFILPQLFESDGKGSPRKRVKGYNLIHSEPLSSNFTTPEKTEVLIHGVFQIWSKHTTNETYALKQLKDKAFTIYSLSDGGTVATTRNKKMIGKCDIYLPSTCFGKENMKVYSRFTDLPGQKGYGVVFHERKTELLEKATKIDWSSVSFLSTNSAYNLRTSYIFQQLT